MSKMALVEYATPRERALGTLRRQLVLDATTVAIGLLGYVPMEGPVNWRYVGLATGLLLFKTLQTTAAKYDRAVRDDATATLEMPEE